MGEEKRGRLLELMRSMEAHGIHEDNPIRHKIYGQYLDGLAREEGYPRMGVFELTPLCNLDCRMCYVHLRMDQLKGEKLLTKEQWISLMEQAVECGMLDAQLTGGEAMMHPDFNDIYLYLHEKGIRIIVMTNGILLNQERIAFFKKYPPAALQITLYGGSEETYERVTGHRMYHTVTEHIKEAKEIGCRISITATPSYYFGMEDVRAVSRFCAEQGLKLKVNADLNEAREETGRTIGDFDLSSEEYFKIQDLMTPEEMRKPVGEKDLPRMGDADEPAYGMRCGAGRSLFCVKWNGRMQICLDIPRCEDPFAMGFSEAWKRLHAYAISYEIPRECMNCAYRAICTVCPVQHAKGGRPGHVDRRICERTRKLVREGYRRLPELEREC